MQLLLVKNKRQYVHGQESQEAHKTKPVSADPDIKPFPGLMTFWLFWPPLTAIPQIADPCCPLTKVGIAGTSTHFHTDCVCGCKSFGTGLQFRSGKLTETNPPLLSEETFPLKTPAGPPVSPSPGTVRKLDSLTPPITTSSRAPHPLAAPCRKQHRTVGLNRKLGFLLELVDGFQGMLELEGWYWW